MEQKPFPSSASSAVVPRVPVLDLDAVVPVDALRCLENSPSDHNLALVAWRKLMEAESLACSTTVMKTRVYSSLSQFILPVKRFTNKHVERGGIRATHDCCFPTGLPDRGTAFYHF